MPSPTPFLASGGLDEFDAMESAVRSYCRSFPRLFTRARGAVMFDGEGRRYIDFLCGAGALGYGHNDPEIKRAVMAYLEADGVVTSLDLHTSAKLAFLRTFRDVILRPRGLDYRVQFCGPTGADAVEAALKLARRTTGRHEVIAFTNAYHGVTLGALAATANPGKRGASGTPLAHVARMPYEGFLGAEVDTIALLEAMLGPGGGLDRPAAIIVETVQAEGGLNVASPEWLRRLATLARRHGVVLIVDDIQVGSGRTGSFFSFERSGIEPDIVCLSKAVGGLGLPLAMVLIRPELDAWAPGEHVGTFRGNNLAFVAAAAALERWRDPNFLEVLASRAARLGRGLARLAEQHPDLGARPRGLGMIQGLACRTADVAEAVRRHAFAEGLILERVGPRRDVLKLLPPFTISEDELDEGLAMLGAAMRLASARGGAAEERELSGAV